MHRLLALLAVCNSGTLLQAQQEVSFPLLNKPGNIVGDLYGHGPRAVVLAHGGRFGKESWKKQAEALARAGFVVLAVRFRGDRSNPDGSTGAFGSTPDNTDDVLAAVDYLHRKGVKDVSAVGGSMGGDAVGEADAKSAPGNITHIVLLGSSGGDHPGKLSGQKLFIVAREDRSGDGLRLPGIFQNYAAAPKPKRLLILDGSAHAQLLFDTDQGPRVLNEIKAFLSRP